LYAWFVYRFYPVAEHHALACLELALRERYEKEIPKEYYKHSKFVTLKPLLRYAVDKGDVKNEGFKHWHEAAEIRARTRYQYERVDEMRKKGLNQIELDYSDARVTDIDRNMGYINDVIEMLPELRNHYAHGSKMLHNQVLGTIQVVAEIINQIYPDNSDVAK
jgi:phosphoenolpyruvate carboxylase